MALLMVVIAGVAVLKMIDPAPVPSALVTASVITPFHVELPLPRRVNVLAVAPSVIRKKTVFSLSGAPAPSVRVPTTLRLGAVVVRFSNDRLVCAAWMVNWVVADAVASEALPANVACNN